jgi:hypothetical protein
MSLGQKLYFFLVHISARMILTEVLRDFPQTFEASSGAVFRAHQNKISLQVFLLSWSIVY